MAGHHHLTASEDKVNIWDAQLLRRLLALARPYWVWLSLALVMILVGTLLELIPPYLVKIAIDDYFIPNPPGAAAGIRNLTLLYFGLAISVLAATYSQTYILQRAGQQITYDLRYRIFNHLQKLTVEFYDKQPTGQLVTRVTNDTQALNQLYVEVLINLFQDLFLLAGTVIVMLNLHPRLALIALGGVPLIASCTWLYRHFARQAYRQVRLHLGRINAFLQEHLAGIKVIQAFAREEATCQEFSSITGDYYRASRQELNIGAIFRPAMDLIYSLIVAVLVWYGGGDVIQNLVSFGVLYAMITYTEQFFRPINDLAEKYTLMQSALAAAEKVFQLLDEKPGAEDLPQPVLPGQIRGEVSFHRVWFSYHPGEWVLQDISFSVHPGEMLAIVGPTGAGKTTIISLIERFYDVQRGYVSVDGIDVRQWPQRELRRKIGLVSQDIAIFSGTIIDNLTLGQTVETEQLQRAITLAQADFIQALPEGMNTWLVAGGANISQGQRQLLALARALVMDTPILILDEATANVDTETERRMQAALEGIRRDRTVIVIAHRLSTIVRADKIIVISQGRLVEEGQHASLLARQGLYYRLWKIEDAQKNLQADGKGFIF